MQLQTRTDIAALRPSPLRPSSLGIHPPDLTPRLWVEAVPTIPSTGVEDAPCPATVRLMVSGDLDEVTRTSMEDAALDALDAGPELLVLDLSGIIFIDTAGLRSIVTTTNTAERRGVRVVVGGMSGGVERLLELTGLVEQLGHAEHRIVNPN